MATIELKEVRKTFETTEILKGIDLAIEDGEFVALIGPSGAASRHCCASLPVLSRRHQAK